MPTRRRLYCCTPPEQMFRIFILRSTRTTDNKGRKRKVILPLPFSLESMIIVNRHTIHTNEFLEVFAKAEDATVNMVSKFLAMESFLSTKVISCLNCTDINTFECYATFHIESFQDTPGHLPFKLLQQKEPMETPTARWTSNSFSEQVLACNLVSKALHLSTRRLSKLTPNSDGWRLTISFSQTSHILKL